MASNDPASYVDTPGGRMEAAAQFLWNGTAWVARSDGGSQITYTQTVVALTATDGVVIAANAARKDLWLINIGTGLATLGFGAVAVAGQGYPLAAAGAVGDQGGGWQGNTAQAIHGICASGVTTSLLVLEGV